MAGIPAAWPDHAELDFEAIAEALDEQDDRSPEADWSTGLPSPGRMRVALRNRGEAADREAVATEMLLVATGVSPQPDGIALLPGEHWHVRGHRLSDGTIMPCRGTYRISAAPGPAENREVR